jgi:hypothetical protein
VEGTSAPSAIEIDPSAFAALPDRRAGVVFVATGDDYVEAARLSALSVRRSNPTLPIALFCDCAPRIGAEADPFSVVHPVSQPHRRSKVDYLPHTPFERTLYLDADVRVVSDLSEVFGVLDRFDVALAHAHARNHRSTNTPWRVAIPRGFPQFNGGVIAWRRSERTQAFLRAWRDAYHESGFRKDQVTLRELLWLSDLRIATLPPEYNLRYPKYLWLWGRDEARAKILHMAWFKQRSKLGPLRDSIVGRLARAGGAARRDVPRA